MLDSKKDQRYEREGKNLLALSMPIAKGIDNLRSGAKDRKDKDPTGAEKLEATAQRIEEKLLILLHEIDSAIVEDILNRFSELGSEMTQNTDPTEKKMDGVATPIPEPLREKPTLSSVEKYKNARRDTEEKIQGKITYYDTMIAKAEEQIKQRSWGEVFDSTLKAGGLFGQTAQGGEKQELQKLQEARTRYGKEQGVFLSRFPEKTVNDAKGIDASFKDLQEYRTRLGLPALPSDLVENYDDRVAMANRARSEGKKMDMDWQAINEELRGSAVVLDAWETFFNSVDTGMQVATNAVPYGNIVYNFAKNATSIGVGSKSPEDAAKEFAIDFISSKLAGGAVKGLKGGGKMVLQKIQPMAEKFGKSMAKISPKTFEKVVKAFGTKATEAAAKEGVETGLQKLAKVSFKSVFTGSLEGAGSGAIQSGLSRAGDEAYQVLFNDKSADTAVDDFLHFAQSDQLLYSALMAGSMQGFFKTFQGRMGQWRQKLIAESPKGVQNFVAFEEKLSKRIEEFHSKLVEKAKTVFGGSPKKVMETAKSALPTEKEKKDSKEHSAQEGGENRQHGTNPEKKNDSTGSATELKTIVEHMQSVKDEHLPQIITEYNSTYPEGRSDHLFKVIRKTNQGIVTFNEQGKMELLQITKGNARDVLARTKKATDFGAENSGFELRQECLRMDPDMPTHLAYTYGDMPETKREMKAYIANPANWIPEKRQFHEKLFAEAMDKVRENSKSFSPEAVDAERVVVIMRGNTAAGKSSTLRKAEAPSLRALNASPNGAINPDDMKSIIRSQEKNGDKHSISHDQAHSEGSMVAEKIIDQAFEENLNMVVIDKRFASVKDVTEVTNIAREKGYKVVIVDVDAELETSIARVHGGEALGRSYEGRNPDLDDPVVPVHRITEGYNDVVRDRSAVVGQADQYYLYKTDVQGENGPVLVAESQNGNLTVHHQKLFDHVTRNVNEENAFVATTMLNLRNTSRTSNGVVDTSATTAKAESMAASGEQAGKIANRNFESTMHQLHTERNRQFTSPDELGQFIEKTALDVNRGILKEGMLLRTADSSKFPYTRIADLPQSFETFKQEFFHRLNDPKQNPRELAAWVEFNIDLTHHFFEDGCGKVSKALSAWVLARGSADLPQYRGREEYYQNAPQRLPTDTPAVRESQFQKWNSYYSTLFHAPKS